MQHVALRFADGHPSQAGRRRPHWAVSVGGSVGTGHRVIGICTDSQAQLPAELATRFGIEVVPLTIVVDDHEYLEGVDLTPDAFYDMYTADHQPTVTISEPSPGQFAVAYDDLAERGCTQILSIHTSTSMSANINVARLAARMAPVPVRLIDSRSARFGVSCCVWAAADAIAAGASLDDAATIAESLAPHIGSVFVLHLDRLIAGGLAGDGDDVSVMTLCGGDRLKVVDRVTTVADAVIAMARFTVVHGRHLRVAVGTAQQSGQPVADALARAIGEAAAVDEVVQFRIGPSVGMETGPAAVGCVVYPRTVPAVNA